ncbi:MAG: MFS transporter [Ilumatobacteraceae bacterium]
MVFGWYFLREHREPTAGRFDVVGFVASGAGLAMLLFGLSEGAENGWTEPRALGPLVAGLVSFVVLVWWERRCAEPILALRLYGERMFRNANIVLTFTYGSFAGVLFLVPLFLQDYGGLSALESGLATFPQALGVMVSSQVAGRLYPIVGPRRLITAGLLVVAAATLPFLWFDAGTDLWWVRTVMFARGLGMAFSFVPMQAATYANITPADTGRASAIYSTQRQVAAALGVAGLATIWQTFSRSDGTLGGYHAGFGSRRRRRCAGRRVRVHAHPRQRRGLYDATPAQRRLAGGRRAGRHAADRLTGAAQETIEATATKCDAAASTVNTCQISW